MQGKRILFKILSGSRNVKFREVVALAKSIGFTQDRVNGSHHIFVHPDIPEILNIQNVKGEAKPYQINQLVKLIDKHNLHVEDR